MRELFVGLVVGMLGGIIFATCFSYSISHEYVLIAEGGPLMHNIKSLHECEELNKFFDVKAICIQE